MSFQMPSSWYDPPEYGLQKWAEEVDSRNLFGLYEVDPTTNKIVRYDSLPDDYGSEEEIQRLYDELVSDDPENANYYCVENLSFDACCEIAEREADHASEWADDRDDYYDDGPDY